jgi:hypothetical protein
MIHVYINKGTKHVAMINRQSRGADNFNAAEPWLLLHDTGRTDRFASCKEAKEEALKSYAPLRFSKS